MEYLQASADLLPSGQASMADKTRPPIRDPGDAIVRIASSTICVESRRAVSGW